jgi:serine-type D-Ala-D-Ala carboxypeptidase
MKLRTGTAEESGMSSRRIEHIRQVAETWVERGDVQALVLLAARRGVIFLHQAWGKQTADDDSPPVAVDSLFPIASVTKVITATAVMCLVENGLIGLNRPVQEYIPEFAGEGKQAVIVHHLLTHTSGWDGNALDKQIEEMLGTAGIPTSGVGHAEIARHLSLVYSTPLHYAAGECMWYSDYHFELLGEIVHRVSGKPLEDFARARIFEPLDMNESYFVVPEGESDRVVRRPATALGSEYESRREQETPWAAGGVYSTAGDMASFCQMFLNHGAYGGERVLSFASVQEMTRNQIPGIAAHFNGELFPEACWGYGWSIHGNKRGFCGGLYSPRAFEHWGTGRVYVWVDPVHEVVGVFLSIVPFSSDDPAYWRCFHGDLFTDIVTAAIEPAAGNDNAG